MAVLTKRAVCNYSAGSHLVSLQNKSVINEAAQNSCRNERKMRFHLTESSSHNRYCLIKIFPKLFCGFSSPSLAFNDIHPAAELQQHPSQHSQPRLCKFLLHPEHIDGSGDGAALPAAPRVMAQPRDTDSHQGRGTGGMAASERHQEISLLHRRQLLGWSSSQSSKRQLMQDHEQDQEHEEAVALLLSPSHLPSSILHPMEPLHPLKLLA